MIDDVVIDLIRSQLGRDDIPFDIPLVQLGVDSLDSIEISQLIEEKCGVELDHRFISETATLRDVIDQVSSIRATTAKTHTTTSTAQEEFDLTEAQKALWVLQKLDPELSAYNLGEALIVNARLEPARLQVAAG